MKKDLITSALVLSYSTFVYGESSITELPPINVYSAYATPVNQDQTASSVTVLTEKDFASRNATYVSDVLKTVPGVAISSNGGRGTLTSLFLRGANSNQIAVIIDGVKMKPVNNLGFDFGGLTLSNIERIEVLRGEQSSLWGSDAMGGVIYITTKSGLYKEKPLNVDFDLGTGSHRTRNGSVTVSGYNNGFYYALHGDSHRTSGISSLSQHQFHYSSPTGIPFSTGGHSEKDGFHRDNASLRLGYDDNQKGIELLASHSSQTGHYDNDSRVFAQETLFDDYTHTRETLFKLSGYVGSDDDLLKHKISISHLKTSNDTYDLYPNSTKPYSSYDAKKLNANYQLDINFDREGYIKQGVSLLTEYQRSTYDSTNFTPRDEKKLTEKSVAAEYRLFTEDDHSLSLSGRYTENAKYENAWTGRISGAYRLSPNFRTHTSLGSAIQNPSLIDYYGYFGNYRGNPNLKPAKSLGGEVGLLMETTDKSHSLDVTYFARNVKNFIANNPTFTGVINLDGTTKIKGVEIAYNGKLTEYLTAYANYTYTQTKNSQGISLIRRPKHTANAGLAYQVTKKLGTDVNISYVGKRTDNYYGPTPSYASYSGVKMPSYTLVNIGTNYQLTKNVNVYINLNNLFDKKYENVLRYGQDGRNVYVGLKGSF
ncbi:TonB-dependent receptor plug domain-containing protein [Rodentibacter genomosp. 2]|uniref:Cobalamin receptor n=1 Tax=Rodentibacter genomosp. 2 TaxID=1908266 RepID=A0A1V3JDW4_9PAST|nr:TonB-dependent receptor [Rodentibacter genomosp. 2]OOF54587.1 cobalamin receptor [Rodentibacter genomosp. 2]